MLSLQVASPMYQDCVLNRVNALWCQETALSSAAQDHHAAAIPISFTMPSVLSVAAPTASPFAPSKARSPSIVAAKSIIIINQVFDLDPDTTEAAPLPDLHTHVPASPIAELHTPASLPTTLQTGKSFSESSATETSDEDSSDLLPTPCSKFQALSSARLQQRARQHAVSPRLDRQVLCPWYPRGCCLHKLRSSGQYLHAPNVQSRRLLPPR